MSIGNLILPTVFQPRNDAVSGLFRRASSFLRADPDFIIAGVQKGGTTSLFSWISKHPQFRPPFKKEINFFNSSEREKGISYYRSYFTPKFMQFGGKITGEATPNYFDHSSVALDIYHQYPSLKVIVLLRNPVERAWSHYRMSFGKGFENRTFYDALSLEEERIEAVNNSQMDRWKKNLVYERLGYKSKGYYAPKLKIWVELFGIENVFVINSDEMFRSPLPVFNNVCRFLKIEENSVNDFTKINEGISFPKDDNSMEFLYKWFSPKNQELKKLTGVNFQW
ncbi:MAG: sulfotransferase family protein [Flavobacteriales bacterium]